MLTVCQLQMHATTTTSLNACVNAANELLVVVVVAVSVSDSLVNSDDSPAADVSVSCSTESAVTSASEAASALATAPTQLLAFDLSEKK